jgi:hypothetical protein
MDPILGGRTLFSVHDQKASRSCLFHAARLFTSSKYESNFISIEMKTEKGPLLVLFLLSSRERASPINRIIMSFAEQLALASSKKKLNIATTRKAATAANHSSLSSSEGGSFADRIRAASTPTAAGGATPSSKIKITATTPSQLQPTAPVSSSSFTFADELQQKSQQSGRRKATSHVHSNIEHQHTHDGSDDDDDEYSAVGFSLSSTPTRDEIVRTTSTTDAARNKKNKKKLKPVIIVPSESSVGVEQQQQEEVPQLSPPLQRQQQQRQQQQQQQSSNNLPQHPINQSHNDNINADNSNTNNNKEVFGAWAQIESLKRRVHEAEQRAEMASYELKVMKDHNNHRSSTTIIPVTISNMDDDGRHANKVDEEENEDDDDDGNDALQNDYNYSEIDEWKRRALEAEERLLAQRRHDPIMIELPPPQQQHLLSPQQQQQQQLLTPPQSTTQSSVCTSTTTTTTTPRVGFLDNESSFLELIRLKNAEIDVLRSQIHRLERLIQEECDRSEDLFLRQQQQQQQQTSYRHHYHNCDGSTSPPSVVLGDDIVGRDELQLLRNEIQYLKYELRRKGTAVTNNLTAGDKSSYNAANGNKTSGSTTGSTLSSLDENENNYVEGAEEVGDDDDNGGGGGCCSSWGLCCVRRRAARRRGYGRV